MTIVLDAPKTAARAGDRDALIEALYRTPGKAEIVNGEIREYMATGGIPNYAAGEIFAELRQYARATRRGVAVTDGAGFTVKLPNRSSFSPDAAFWTGVAPTAKFYEGAPVFAVEVRSEGDSGPVAEAEMREKRRDYFAAGTEVVWDVDTRSDAATVRKYTRTGGAEVPARTYGKGDTADAEPALPGFAAAVRDLFPDVEG